VGILQRSQVSLAAPLHPLTALSCLPYKICSNLHRKLDKAKKPVLSAPKKTRLIR
jgi:hypothetical protein